MVLKPQVSWAVVRLLFCISTVGSLGFLPEIAQAQLIPDNTLGTERSQIFSSGIRDRIDGGAVRGANLFHSFAEFNVGTGRGVYFANPAGIANIFSRVTGRNGSGIDGALGVLGNANLFLLNPNGILFGSNARLDVAGSFLASTADRFRFADGSEFGTVNPQAAPLFLVNVPLGLQVGRVQAGTEITNRGSLVSGQDLTLVADNLDLQGQLQAGRDLILLANHSVTARDTKDVPFLAQAVGSLVVQGNQGIDIATLSHPLSGWSSGKNLVLRSDKTVGGDARFWSGGNFSIERLDGSLGNLFSPYDPVILSNGDVTLGDYTGASLHILAGGSVTLSNVTITGTGDVASTINPSNTTAFNGSQTYADLASFNLTDYKATLNSDGTVRSVDSVAVPITINGSTQSTLDVRAGVDWAKLGGLPTSPAIAGVVTPATTLTETTSSADITIDGNISINLSAGLILLTNQFSPNTLPGTITIRGDVDTSTTTPETNGGDIYVHSRGGINVVGSAPDDRISIDSSAFTSGILSATGNGGIISIYADSDNISLTNSNLNSTSIAESDLSSGTAGNGGMISLSTNLGDISLTDSDALSASASRVLLSSSSEPNLYSGNSGGGGAISFATNSGNISLTDSNLLSSSHSEVVPDPESEFASESESNLSSGNSGSGGAVSFATNFGDISLSSSSLLTLSYSFSISDSALSTGSNLSSGDAGNGGGVSLATNFGNIFLSESEFSSTSLSLSALRSAESDISFSSDSLSGRSGRGGTINLSARDGEIFGISSFLNSFSVSNQGESGNGGNVKLETGSNLSGLTVNTITSGGKAGGVNVNGFDNLFIDEINIETAQKFEVKSCPDCTPIQVNLSGKGQAGDVAIDSTHGITFNNSIIQSDTRSEKSAGIISGNCSTGG
jgi:filamentous hemagglutinin family protein